MIECPKCKTLAGRAIGPLHYICNQCGNRWHEEQKCGRKENCPPYENLFMSRDGLVRNPKK